MADLWIPIVVGFFGAIIFPIARERLARPQWAVMTELRFAQRPLSPSELHSALQGSFGPATVNQILVTLERKKYVVSKSGDDGVRFELSPQIGELQGLRRRRILTWAGIGYLTVAPIAFELFLLR